MKNLLLSAAIAAATFSFGLISAQAEVTNCTEITTLPTTITVPGIYCMKSNLGTNITSGAAITVDANNVVIEMNGWRIGGATAGLGTGADGIQSNNRKNIIIRNGIIRGFLKAIDLRGSSGSSGHLVEDMLIDGNRHLGIDIQGDGVRILNNTVVNTGPGDATSVAIGIKVEDGRGILIKGNMISGLEETGQIFGVRLENTIEAEISDNQVFDINEGFTETGISMVGGDQSVVFDNTIIAEFGSGIFDNGINSDDTVCINNRVRADSTLVFCDVEAGNTEF